MTKITLLLATLSLLFLSSCGGSNESLENSKFTEQVSENIFHNAYFKMTVQKPDEWVALDHSAEEALFQHGVDVAFSGNNDLKNLHEAAEKNYYTLFTFFRCEPGTPVDVNQNVIGLAEKVTHMPGIKTGKDYFFHSKKIMSQSNLQYSFSEGYRQREIDGIVFDQMDLTITFAGGSAKRSYYSTKHNDFMITIIESYGDEQDRTETEKMLDGITFDW